MARKPKASAASARPKYKPGYIVHVRSGGPEMTIESIEANGDLNCVWFAMEGDKWEPPCRERFVAASVQMAVDGDLIDSQRGRYIDDDGQVVPPEEPSGLLRPDKAALGIKRRPPTGPKRF